MRLLFRVLAVGLGAIAIALAARYGFMTADTTVDAVLSGVVFAAIALCAFLFDAAAVRLWFEGHRIGGIAIGLIAFAALIVTFTNNLGAIAGRGDALHAKRQNVTDTRADDRRELQRLEGAITALGIYTPTDDATVKATQRTVDSATAARKAECDKRGPLCKQWERDLAAASAKLAEVTAAKATTDRATKLEAEIAAVRSKLGRTGDDVVSTPNPLGKALENIFGGSSATLSSWQQAVVAAVFDLCLVGVMVIHELLGQRPQPTHPGGVAAQPAPTLRSPATPPPALPPPRNARSRRSRGAADGSLKTFLSKHLFPADEGERVDMKRLLEMYRDWCAETGVAAVELHRFVDEMEALCGKIGVKIEAGEDQRIYCHGIRVEGTQRRTI